MKELPSTKGLNKKSLGGGDRAHAGGMLDRNILPDTFPPTEELWRRYSVIHAVVRKVRGRCAEILRLDETPNSD